MGENDAIRYDYNYYTKIEREKQNSFIHVSSLQHTYTVYVYKNDTAWNYIIFPTCIYYREISLSLFLSLSLDSGAEFDKKLRSCVLAVFSF